MSFVVLSVRHPQVPVLHNPERLKDETMRIIVAARGVEQPSPCHQGAFGNAFLADYGEARVGHHVVGIGLEIAFHAVYLYALRDVARNDTVIVALLGEVAVMTVGRAVGKEQGALYVPLDGTLVGSQREEQLVETLHMLARLDRTVLGEVLCQSQHQRPAFVEDIDLLALRLGETVCLPYRIPHEERAGAQIDYAEQPELAEAALDVF